MTDKMNLLLKGATAVAAAALVAGLLIAYTNSAKLGGEGGEGEDEDREEHVQTTKSGDDLLPDHLRDAAQALHPGRIVEMEPKNGGRAFGIETVDADGAKWKMVFDADGKLLRDKRD
jgi:uncharacterized membrane protein YkoI